MSDYADLLAHSYEVTRELLGDKSRREWISDHIFEFTTYEDVCAKLFAKKALEVCRAITDRTTFDYINTGEGEVNRVWFLLMVNMPFFAKRIEWGTSARGAWWDSYHGIKLESDSIYRDWEQVLEMDFTAEEWPRFIDALCEFAALDDRSSANCTKGHCTD